MPILDSIIDISHHNTVEPANGFHDIARAGIMATVLKATEGRSLVDPTFAERIARARSVGLLVGSYHFGRAGSGQEQAAHYLDTVKPGTRELVCLDWEDGRLTLTEAESFATYVERAIGRWPLLYSSPSFLTRRGVSLMSPLFHCPLWIARYSRSLGRLPRPWTDWTLWQYTDTGRVPGILGAVDRNRFTGDRGDLAARWPF